MYAPRDTPVAGQQQQHDSDSEGHSMSGSNSTGDQPLLPRQASPAPGPAGPSTSAEHTSPTSLGSGSEHNVGLGMGTGLPTMPQPAMIQLPSRMSSVSYTAPPGPPPPPPNSDKRPILDRANTTSMTQRPTTMATRSYNRPVSDTLSIDKALHDESAPVSPSGRELNFSSGSPRYPNPAPMMTGRESGLNLTEAERRHAIAAQRNIVDYIAPTVASPAAPPSLTGQPKSVEERLSATLETAKKEEDRFSKKGEYLSILPRLRTLDLQTD